MRVHDACLLDSYYSSLASRGNSCTMGQKKVYKVAFENFITIWIQGVFSKSKLKLYVLKSNQSSTMVDLINTRSLLIEAAIGWKITFYKKFSALRVLSTPHCTDVRFASFLSGGFITMAVINPPDWKLANRTSVHCANVPTTQAWKIISIITKIIWPHCV